MNHRTEKRRGAWAFALALLLLLIGSGLQAQQPQTLGDGVGLATERAGQVRQIDADKSGFVNELLSRWAGEAAARGQDLFWQKGQRNLLLKTGEELLSLSERAKDYDTFNKLVFQGFTVNALGELRQDLVYVPLDPCRLLDTRTGTGSFAGPLAPGTQVSFSVNDSLAVQGGNAAGCGVPNTAPDPPALSIVVTAVPANAGQGNLRTFPSDAAAIPTASVVNYQGGVVVASGTITPDCVNCVNEMTVRNQGAGTTHVVIDVTGYFWPAEFGATNGAVWASAKINGTTPSVIRYFNNAGSGVSVSSVGTGMYQINFGTDVSARHYNVAVSAGDGSYVTSGGCGVTTRSGVATALFVHCWDAAGADATRDFVIQVF